MVADVSYLEVPVMAPGEAGRQLGIPASTLKHWLDGHHVGSRFYPPVLRPEPSPAADVTWGEMVEADYLRVIYELATGHLELHPRAVTFLERVDRGGDASADVALALMPDGPESPVRQEPGVSSGASAVGGIRTEILREQYEVGEDTRDIAEMFGLGVHDVLAALRHEDRLRPLKIA